MVFCTDQRSKPSAVRQAYTTITAAESAVIAPRYSGMFGEAHRDDEVAAYLQRLCGDSDDSGLLMMHRLLHQKDDSGSMTRQALSILRAMALGTHNVVFGRFWFILRPLEEI
jgi:hypothetical protein